MEDEAWIEAWICRKPRRIIHNQLLIETLLALAIISPIPLSGIFFWLVFCFYPAVVVPAILIAWLTLFVSYTTLKLYAFTHEKKNRNPADFPGVS